MKPHEKVHEYAVLYNFTVCMRYLFDLLCEAKTEVMGLADLLSFFRNRLPELDEKQLEKAGMIYAGLRHYHPRFSIDQLRKHQVAQGTEGMCELLEAIVALKGSSKKYRETSL